MAKIYGSQARVYGINGNVAADDNTGSTPTDWPDLIAAANTDCIITGYTYTPSMQGNVQGFDQFGRLTSEAFAYAQFEITVNFEFGGDSIAESKTLKMPDLMAKITLENMDNSDLNGAYNFISGSVTGSNQGWKTGTMTLRAISDPGNTLSLNKQALAEIPT
jgi:hypothetical protein